MVEYTILCIHRPAWRYKGTKKRLDNGDVHHEKIRAGDKATVGTKDCNKALCSCVNGRVWNGSIAPVVHVQGYWHYFSGFGTVEPGRDDILYNDNLAVTILFHRINYAYTQLAITITSLITVCFAGMNVLL